LVDAVKAAGLKHVVYSCLEDSRSVLKDKAPALDKDYTVPFFDGKE